MSVHDSDRHGRFNGELDLSFDMIGQFFKVSSFFGK